MTQEIIVHLIDYNTIDGGCDESRHISEFHD